MADRVTSSPPSVPCFDFGRRFARCGVIVVAFCGALSLAAKEAKEQWVAVSSPYFTVLTPAKAEAARLWAMELERFRLAMQLVVNVPESRLRPVTVVLFPNDAAMRPFKPLAQGQPRAIKGLFSHFCDSHTIQLSLDGKSDETRHVIFHEAVHWYSNAGEVIQPLWLEEGVAEVYSTFSMSRDGTGSFGNAIPRHLKLLRQDKSWSMERLVGTTRDSIAYNEGSRASTFYAGSWLAAHYLLFGQGSAGRASIPRYLELRQRFGDTPETFERAFGVNYAGFQAQLANYLKSGKYAVQHLNLFAPEIERRLTTRVATDAEVELALGTLLIGSREDAREQGAARVQRAAKQDPANPAAWQVLGEVALRDRSYQEAELSFERSIAAGSTSYFSFYGRGICRSQRIRPTGQRIDQKIASLAVGDFRRALELNPRFVPAYEGFAWLMYATESIDPNDRQLLEEGARLAPGNLVIDIGLASIDLRSGKESAGQRRLDLVLQTPLGLHDEVRKLALGVRESHSWNSLFLQLQKLFVAQKYEEGIHLIDATKDRFSDPQILTYLAQNRLMASSFDQIEKAVALVNSGHPKAAQKLLNEVLESAADESAKKEARRLLQEIGR